MRDELARAPRRDPRTWRQAARHAGLPPRGDLPGGERRRARPDRPLRRPAWRSVGTVGGEEGIHTFENDTGPDDANHAQDGLMIMAGPESSPAARRDAPPGRRADGARAPGVGAPASDARDEPAAVARRAGAGRASARLARAPEPSRASLCCRRDACEAATRSAARTWRPRLHSAASTRSASSARVDIALERQQ